MITIEVGYKDLLEQLETLQQENAELKASVNALRDGYIAVLQNHLIFCEGMKVEQARIHANVGLNELVASQSLAEHDKQVRNEALEEAAKACDGCGYVADSGACHTAAEEIRMLKQ